MKTHKSGESLPCWIWDWAARARIPKAESFQAVWVPELVELCGLGTMLERDGGILSDSADQGVAPRLGTGFKMSIDPAVLSMVIYFRLLHSTVGSRC